MTLLCGLSCRACSSWLASPCANTSRHRHFSFSKAARHTRPFSRLVGVQVDLTHEIAFGKVCACRLGSVSICCSYSRAFRYGSIYPERTVRGAVRRPPTAFSASGIPPVPLRGVQASCGSGAFNVRPATAAVIVRGFRSWCGIAHDRSSQW